SLYGHNDRNAGLGRHRSDVEAAGPTGTIDRLPDVVVVRATNLPELPRGLGVRLANFFGNGVATVDKGVDRGGGPIDAPAPLATGVGASIFLARSFGLPLNPRAASFQPECAGLHFGGKQLRACPTRLGVAAVAREPAG
ncbi:MAG: hypothetical protein OEY55_15280, partial [Acidimicrobiia bacterium]|nr:hypothetical protein [Acidimicrobiia bacterium]